MSENPMPEKTEPIALAEQALAIGDHVRARELTESLLTSTDEPVRSAAQRIHRATEIDPAQVVVVLLCLLLFIAITYKYVF